jgi:hypothetical protein
VFFSGVVAFRRVAESAYKRVHIFIAGLMGVPPPFEVGLREIFPFDGRGLVFGVRQVLIEQVVDSIFNLVVAQLRAKRFVFKILEIPTCERILSLLKNLRDMGCTIALG